MFIDALKQTHCFTLKAIQILFRSSVLVTTSDTYDLTLEHYFKVCDIHNWFVNNQPYIQDTNPQTHNMAPGLYSGYHFNKGYLC